MRRNIIFISLLTLITVAITGAALVGENYINRHLPTTCITSTVFNPAQICDARTSSWQWYAAQALMYIWLIVPIVGTIVAAVKMRSRQGLKNKMAYLFVPVFIGILMSVIEVIIYKPWVHYLTPAGTVYSRYSLDAFYPGFTILLIIIFGFTALILWTAGIVSNSVYNSKSNIAIK